MSFSNCVVLILSPFNNKNDFERIYNSVAGIDLNKLKEETIFEIPMYNKIPKKMLEPFEALRNQYKLKLYKECVGKTAMQYVTPYPPGIPLICPGELIDEEIIESIEKCLASGHQVIGINDDAIKILDL